MFKRKNYSIKNQKFEDIIENELDDPNEIVDFIENENNLKCGEVYFKNGKFLFCCEFCTKYFRGLDIYINHVSFYHCMIPKENVDNTQIEDQLDAQNVNIEVQYSNVEEVTDFTDFENIEAKDPSDVAETLQMPSTTYNMIAEIQHETIDSLLDHMESCVINLANNETKAIVNPAQENNEDDQHAVCDNEVPTEIPKMLENENNLINYSVTFQNEDNRFPCLFCSKTYSSFITFKNHFEKMHIKAISHKCNYCASVFQCFDSLKIHILSSHQEQATKKNFLHKNEFHFKRTTTSTSDSENIQKSFEYVNEIYQCLICGNTYVTNDEIEKHIKLKHIKKPPALSHTCSYCDKKFLQKQSLKYHLNCHTGEKPYKCEICMTGFANPKTAEFHLRTHFGDKRFFCSFCPKKFIQKNEKISHERLVHNSDLKPYQCDICGAVFGIKSKLTNHQKLHHDTSYKCEICFKNFKNIEQLKNHKKIHSIEKPYQCMICSAKFKLLLHLRNHEKLHTGIKEFICKICNKAFAQKPGLYNHMKRTH